MGDTLNKMGGGPASAYGEIALGVYDDVAGK